MHVWWQACLIPIMTDLGVPVEQAAAYAAGMAALNRTQAVELTVTGCTPPPAPPADDNAGGSKAVVGIAGGALLLIACIGCCVHRRKNAQLVRQPSTAISESFVELQDPEGVPSAIHRKPSAYALQPTATLPISTSPLADIGSIPEAIPEVHQHPTRDSMAKSRDARP